jgi:hypothetical protein
VHCAQVITRATPKHAFTVMMTNQTKVLVHPDEMRSTVTANEVLLHSAARMEKEPDRLEYRRNISRLSKLNCVKERPKPRLMQAEMKAQFATRATWTSWY